MRPLFSFSVLCLFMFFATVISAKGSGKSSAKIISKKVTYISGKDTVSGFLAMPEGGGKHPALIVIHEWWGLLPWVEHNAEEFARNGYVALAIDLYRGESTTDPKVAGKLAGSVPKDRAVTDLKSAFEYLKNMKNVDSSKIGSIGWCMGGSYSFVAALTLPQLAEVTVCYGNLSSDPKEVEKIKAPVLCIFGKEDKVYTPESVKGFEAAAKKEGKSVEVHMYPGVGHAFMNPNNKGGYSKEQADKAWKVIYTFLGKNLKK